MYITKVNIVVILICCYKKATDVSPNPFCNNYYMLVIDINTVLNLFIAITTLFCTVTTNVVDTGKTRRNVVITKNRIVTASTIVAKI